MVLPPHQMGQLHHAESQYRSGHELQRQAMQNQHKKEQDRVKETMEHQYFLEENQKLINDTKMRKNALLFQQRESLNTTNARLKELATARVQDERKEFRDAMNNYHVNFSNGTPFEEKKAQGNA